MSESKTSVVTFRGGDDEHIVIRGSADENYQRLIRGKALVAIDGKRMIVNWTNSLFIKDR